jgi:acetyl esterase/lipase
MRETIGQATRFHNKQIAARPVGVAAPTPGMSSILKRVAPIGEARDREILKDAATYVYQERPQGPVQAHVFFPEKPATGPRPLVVFFHSGFWDTPMPTQFVPQCLHFASRGAVAVAAETRTANRNGTGPVEAILDARDLIRWLRHNADTFGINPDQVTVGGAGGGSLLALLTSMPKPKHLPPVDGLDCHAQAIILYSSVVSTTGKSPAAARFPDSASARKYCPMSLIRRKLPPMILFHGKADRITPFDEAERFRRKVRFWGNTCEMVEFEKADHSFFNFNVSHRNFELTTNAADHFLVQRGFLEPEESVEIV